MTTILLYNTESIPYHLTTASLYLLFQVKSECTCEIAVRNTHGPTDLYLCFCNNYIKNVVAAHASGNIFASVPYTSNRFANCVCTTISLLPNCIIIVCKSMYQVFILVVLRVILLSTSKTTKRAPRKASNI